MATCLPGCPLGIDIPGFIRLLREDDALGALTKIRLSNPFPAICGRICPAPCEKACIFFEEGAPVSIRLLERYAADVGKLKMPKEKPMPSIKKKVTVVGSGPAGMSAAYYLAQAGCTVTILESMPEPGGVLRYGIAELRLPNKILDEQFSMLANLGVDVRTNVFVGSTMTMQDIFTTNQSAVLLTLGAGVVQCEDLLGHNLGGVYYASEILMRLAQLSKQNQKTNKNIWHGRDTIVIGGGYAGLDAARLAVRAGQRVTMLFNGLEEELGVSPEDLTLAQEEGVMISAPYSVQSIKDNDHGFCQGVMANALTVVEVEDRLEVKPEVKEQKFFDAQTVILVNRVKANTLISQHLPQLKLDDDGSIWVDGQTGLTSVEKIFAAGNVVTGAGSVVDAIASGKEAAHKILEYLKV